MPFSVPAGRPGYRFDAASGDLERVVRRLRQKEQGDSGERLCCHLCRHGITDRESALAVNGRQVHVRTNPAGVTFEFGCYDQAPGCSAVGTPTTGHSWFPGYAWQLAVCGGCGEHLGWRFRGEGGFFGLILERLVSGMD